MATIYLGRARQTTGQDKVAAIKVIRHDLSHDDRFVAMFLDEAKILSLLQHPNISATYEYGVSAQQHFIAMELLLGRTLADTWDACKKRDLALRMDMCAWIGARVADALHYAHELRDERGTQLHVIHRDVNPANIFLTYDGQVKLFDFGLAKAQGRRAKSSTGVVKGKLPYLAPEQILQHPIDRRTDLYALGTTLWEMTTMRRLFKRQNDVETLLAIKAGLVPDPRATVASYPEDLWRILKRALEREPDDRYPNADAVARDLDKYVRGQGKGSMPALISAILTELFEGEREKQLGWLRKTSALTGAPPRTTQAPPAPVGATPRSKRS